MAAEFELDANVLKAHYLKLQKQAHPDRFVASGAHERRLSVQWSSRINDAYQVLKSDLKRAVYLLQLQGIDPDSEQDTKLSTPFLMQQMTYRERLDQMTSDTKPDDARPLQDELGAEVHSLRTQFSDKLGLADWEGARDIVRQWQFFDKLTRDLSQKLAGIQA